MLCTSNHGAHAQSLDEGLAALAAGRHHAAFTILAPHAESDHPIAQLAMALMYERGQGVPTDATVAAAWIRRAANLNQPHAQHELGIRYYQGNGVPRDFTAARQWWSRAAQQGLVDAQFNAGLMAARGLGGPADVELALSWYRPAAKQGHALAAYGLGVLLSKGYQLDGPSARDWFAKAAAQGVAESQYNLGVLVETLDTDEAVNWYRRAADQGLHVAGAKLAALDPEYVPALDAPLPEEPGEVETPVAAPRQRQPLPGDDGVNRSPWIRAQSSSHYTVQIATVVDEAAIVRFLRTERLPFDTAYFPIDLNGRRRYSAIMGSFGDRAAAQAARNNLAPRLQRARPWVRRLDEVTRLIAEPPD